MKAKRDIAVCSGHIFLDTSVDIRRKVTSFPMEKEGCCGLLFVSWVLLKCTQARANLRVLARESPEVSDVGFCSALVQQSERILDVVYHNHSGWRVRD